MSDLHPDVELAIQHRETRQMIQDLREREPCTDLQAAVTELAHLIAIASDIQKASAHDPRDRDLWTTLRDRAVVVREALS